MSLGHAPCGPARSDLDQSFPYPNGAIGAWGYDFGSGRLIPATRKDHMSYCRPTWTSDYHFTKALRHRLADESASVSALAAAPTTSLLLWGGVDSAGMPYLNPAFVADAPPALPDSAGDHTVTGRDANGRQLFSLSFAMATALSEEAEVSSFVHALPVRAGWEDLAQITLSGPDGTATLDAGSDAPMAILRDPRTGQVRGFLRDVEDPAAVQTAAAGALGRAGESTGHPLQPRHPECAGVEEVSRTPAVRRQWRPFAGGDAARSRRCLTGADAARGPGVRTLGRASNTLSSTRWSISWRRARTSASGRSWTRAMPGWPPSRR